MRLGTILPDEAAVIDLLADWPVQLTAALLNVSASPSALRAGLPAALTSPDEAAG